MKTLGYLPAVFVGVFLLAAGTHAADKSAKFPVPDAASQAAATKLVQSLYDKDISNAKTPEQKSALAGKLTTLGTQESKNLAGKFALFMLATHVAAAAGDVETAFDAIGKLEAAFQIDPVKLKYDTATAAAPSVRSPEPSLLFVLQMNTLTAEAMADEQYDIAQSAADMALEKVKNCKDATIQRDVIAQFQEVKGVVTIVHDSQVASGVLRTRPDDATANQKVGLYRCLIKGDWKTGLPMLARSSDLELRAVATKELVPPSDIDGQLAIGDGWWNLSDKSTGIIKTRMQRRAEKWYKDLDPQLKGLAKVKVDSRLATLAEGNVHVPDADNIVNLLDLVNADKDMVRGKWVMSDGALLADLLDVCSLGFPYKPPEEYDYVVSFTRIEGHGSTEIICAAYGHQFQYTLGDGYDNGSICGFFLIDGQPPKSNPTGRHVPGLPAIGQKCECVIKVRKEGVRAYLDGKLVSEFKTDYKHFSIGVGWELHQGDVVGLGEWGPRTLFDSVVVIEITGKGERLSR